MVTFASGKSGEMGYVRELLILVLLFCPLFAAGQSADMAFIAYNVENLFDPSVSAENPDTAFTPYGENRWTYRRLDRKLMLIARALIATARSYELALVGLCEVENSLVLHRLLTRTPLSALPLAYVHRDSPDSRGIDVALLYNYDLLRLLHRRWVALPMRFAGQRPSREMLVASFEVPSGDTLHVVHCHWPSKFSGVEATAPLRDLASELLVGIIDSINSCHSESYIVVMGDMNCTTRESYFARFSSQCVTTARAEGKLLCLTGQGDGLPSDLASHKYQGVWESIDHLFVSPALLRRRGLRMFQLPASLEVPAFLLEEDQRYVGVRPWRTYLGPRYLGGVSDHLPLLLVLRSPRLGRGAATEDNTAQSDDF